MKTLITKTILRLGLATAFISSGYFVWAAQPDWWTNYALIDDTTRDDQAIATIGQAKHAVQKAYQYFEAELSDVGGAGAEVINLYNNHCLVAPTDPTNDLQPLTLGQLKYLAKPFYDRLNSDAVDWDTSTMNPISADIYPWTVEQSDDNDLALATIGQLKFAFSFNLSGWTATDTDTDGLPDYWEMQIVDADPNDSIVSAEDISPEDDYDDDDISNLEEYQNGLNPIARDAMADLDGDGYPNIYELRNGADPALAENIPTPTVTVDVNGTTSYTRLQSGIDAVTADYSIILVKAGIYQRTGNPNFTIRSNDPKLLLISEEGAAATILDGENTFSGGTIHNSQSALVGFTLRNCKQDRIPYYTGDPIGGGIRTISGDGNLIKNCLIYNNETYYDGGGVSINGSSNFIENCEIYDNRANTGGGIFERGHNNSILNCGIFGNSGGSGAGLRIRGLYTLIENCDIYQNLSTSSGAGINLDPAFSYSDPTIPRGNSIISACRIYENTGGNNGGGIAFNNTSALVKNSLIYRNNASTYGGGVYVSSNSNSDNVRLVHVTLHSNTSEGRGDEIYYSDTASPAESLTLDFLHNCA